MPLVTDASLLHSDGAAVEVVGGVDTHLDTHTAAVIDLVGRVLATRQFPATAAGYAARLEAAGSG